MNNFRVSFNDLNPAAKEDRPRLTPKSPPRVRVVTTVLHIPAVWDIHVRNLLWSLGNPRIYMLTHRGVDLPEHPNIDYVYAKNLETREELPPEEFSMSRVYHIYDEINHLDFSDVDVVLFMQNDIFFTDKEKVAASVAACHGRGKIVLSIFNPNSHSIYDKDKKQNPEPQMTLSGESGLVYPRVWDGATFVPARLIEQAVADDVEFGYSRKCTLEGGWLYDFALKNWSDYLVGTHGNRDVNGDPFKLVDIIAKGHIVAPTRDKYWELMFEFSLYAFFKNVPFKKFGNYRMSPYAVHFQGARHLFWISNGFPSRDLKTTDDPAHRGRVTDTAFILLMCGLVPMDDLTKHYLRNKQSKQLGDIVSRKSPWVSKQLARQLLQLRLSADQWMSPDELKRLEWASEVIRD